MLASYWEYIVALLTLTGLEIVLGIDNIVFIAIITDRLPKAKQSIARKVGLALAMMERILLLTFLSWIVHLTSPIMTIFSQEISGKDLILVGGGLFLIGKSTLEINSIFDATNQNNQANPKEKKRISLTSALIQITLLDTIFSLDSVITAVGMVDSLPIMIAAIMIAVVIMIIFANPISEFILKHQTIKMLALSFLLLIGVFLIADGLGTHIEKGYIYFAMAFSLLVEGLNFRMRKVSGS